ncbi:DUF2786 domain-containing protein [bacterium]|nr:DUF2786 domain-containing protein [bacterium]
MESNSNFKNVAPEEQRRILDKLAKLKALSECPTGNVNETATAAAAMARLMLEYEIEMADLEASSPLEEVVDEQVTPETSYKGFPTWQTNLLNSLAEVNHCISYTDTRPEYFLWTRRNRSQLGLIGTAKDIENTRRLFLFCVNEIERLCQAWGSKETVKRKNDFKRGAARGVTDKVKAERDQVLREEEARASAQHHSSRALQWFERKELAVRDYADSVGIYYRSTRSRGVSRDAYHAGYEAGANLNLQPDDSRRCLPAGRG